MSRAILEPEEAVAKQRDLEIELGQTGLKESGGEILEEFLADLRGVRGVRTYQEMEANDGVVAAGLRGITLPIAGAGYSVVEASDEPEDAEAAEFLRGCLEDMSAPWPQTLEGILSLITFGWSLLEVVYKRRNGEQKDPGASSHFADGKIGWRKWAPRAQESLDRWLLDPAGGVQGMRQLKPSDGQLVDIPIQKALLFRTTTRNGNPEGRSLLRAAYLPWYRKKHVSVSESIGINRDLTGLPVFYVPEKILAKNATGSEANVRASIEEIGKNLRIDEQAFLMLPLVYDESGNPLWKFELTASAGTRQYDTSAIIARQNVEILVALFTDLILLGHEEKGSWALSRTKQSMYVQGLRALIEEIETVINHVAVPRLFAVNGDRLERYPAFRFGEIAEPDLEGISNFIQRTAAAGAAWFPDDRLDNFLRGLVRAPAKTEGAL